MTKIARKLQKIFGISAPSGQFSEFGSCVEGNPQYSKDPLDIQSRAGFLNGFRGANFATKFPFLEDWNALFLLVTQQLAYFFERGIPEWNSETEYHRYSVVQASGVIYASAQDTNLNRSVIDLDWWTPVATSFEYRKRARFSVGASRIGRMLNDWATANSAANLPWIKVLARTAPFASRLYALESSGTTTALMARTFGSSVWSTITTPAVSWACMAYSPELDILTALNGSGTLNGCMYYRPGAASATQGTIASGYNWMDVCWAEALGKFIAVSGNGVARIGTSTDGITWTTAAAPAEFNAVCWSRDLNLLVAVGQSVCYTSPDGATWTSRTVAANNWRAVCWAAEIDAFAAVSNDGTQRAMISSDGLTWTPQTVEASTWLSVAWSQPLRRLVAVADTGTYRVMYSADGVTWSPLGVTNNAWKSVCWAGEDFGQFVAVSSDGSPGQVLQSKFLGVLK